MLDLVGVRFHRTSRSLRSIWEISEKLDVWIISGCFLSQRTLNIWQWASESCICHLSPFTRRRIMVSQKQFRLVARPNSCKRHFVHPNPLQTSLKHPYKPHMILGCTIFFSETHPILFYAASSITLTWPTKNSRNQGARLPCTSPSLETRKSSESSILGSRFW